MRAELDRLRREAATDPSRRDALRRAEVRAGLRVEGEVTWALSVPLGLWPELRHGPVAMSRIVAEVAEVAGSHVVEAALGRVGRISLSGGFSTLDLPGSSDDDSAAMPGELETSCRRRLPRARTRVLYLRRTVDDLLRMDLCPLCLESVRNRPNAAAANALCFLRIDGPDQRRVHAAQDAGLIP